LKKKEEKIKRMSKINQDPINFFKNIKIIYNHIDKRIRMEILLKKLKRILPKVLKKKISTRLKNLKLLMRYNKK
jgi:Tfp pilus assembly protein PilN